MLTTSALLFGLLGISAAAPLTTRQYQTQKSTGFRLRVFVTDSSPSPKLAESVQNTYLASFHIGAARNLVGMIPDSNISHIFYQNGTSEELQSNKATTISDDGSGPYPEGLSFQVGDGDENGLTTVYSNIGPGDAGVHLVSDNRPVILGPRTFYACAQSIREYHGEVHYIVKHAPAALCDGGNKANCNVPINCVPIWLVPECAQLPAIPSSEAGKTGVASHAYALDSDCYADVAALRLSQINY